MRTVLAGIFLASAVASSAQEPPDFEAWAKRNSSEIEAALKKSDSRIEKAEAAQKKAEKALAYAIRIQDAEAEPIARKAVAKAKRALILRRARERRIRSRMNAFRIVERGRDEKGAWARAGVATVIEGSVRIRYYGERWISLDKPVVVKSGAELETGDDGYAELELPDETTLNLAANSLVKILEYGPLRTVMEWGKGSARWIYLDLKRARYRGINVNRGQNSVRGTQVLVEPGEDGAAVINLLEGSSEFKNEELDKKVTIEEGQRLIIAKDGSFGVPEAIESGTLERWWTAR